MGKSIDDSQVTNWHIAFLKGWPVYYDERNDSNSLIWC